MLDDSEVSKLDLTPVILQLVVEYPETYPDVLPEMSFESIDEESGELTPEEEAKVLESLKAIVCLDLVYCGNETHLRPTKL